MVMVMVLSVEPAMAWAIVHLGSRTLNRSMRTKYRGHLLIHASKSKTHYNQHRSWIESMGYDCPDWGGLIQRCGSGKMPDSLASNWSREGIRTGDDG